MAHPVSGEFLGLKGRFRLGEVLGKGGSGIVHRAYDRQREADVALKILTRVDPLVLYLFKREFRELSGVTHPRLAQLFELFADGDTWFFTMELVDGVDFLTWIAGAQEADGTQSCPPTEATDWYALGVILYRSLAGRLPFGGSARSTSPGGCTWI